MPDIPTGQRCSSLLGFYADSAVMSVSIEMSIYIVTFLLELCEKGAWRLVLIIIITFAQKAKDPSG